MDMLESSLEDYEIDLDDSMVHIRCQRSIDQPLLDRDNTIISFALELPDDSADLNAMVSDFSKVLQEHPLVGHAVKFEDPLLKLQLAKFAEELFGIEMRLRRVLSLIYLNANQLRDPFYLLVSEKNRIPERERQTEDQMRKSNQNELFYLNFSQYKNLNQRSETKLDDIVNMIQNAEDYEVLRKILQRIMQPPVTNRANAMFVSGLRDVMDAIEVMRNCVAHNRYPSQDIIDNYNNAKRRLDEDLDEYLDGLAWPDAIDSV